MRQGGLFGGDLAEPQKTDPAGIRQHLSDLGVSFREAARATNQSHTLISLVLAGKVTSEPCLLRLVALINSRRAAMNASRDA